MIISKFGNFSKTSDSQRWVVGQEFDSLGTGFLNARIKLLTKRGNYWLSTVAAFSTMHFKYFCFRYKMRTFFTFLENNRELCGQTCWKHIWTSGGQKDDYFYWWYQYAIYQWMGRSGKFFNASTSSQIAVLFLYISTWESVDFLEFLINY